MQFADYPSFRTAVQTLLDGDDISTSDLSVNTLDLIIGAGEVRIYRDIRSSVQDTPLSITTTGNVAALPTDFLELKAGPWVTGFVGAIYAPYEAVNNSIQIGADTSSHAVYYTFASDALIFYPTQLDGTVISGQYYKQFPDLVTGLNPLFTRHPDLFLYAALAESAPFLGEMTRLPIWEQKYTGLAESANEQERRRYTRGSKMQTRVA